MKKIKEYKTIFKEAEFVIDTGKHVYNSKDEKGILNAYNNEVIPNKENPIFMYYKRGKKYKHFKIENNKIIWT